MDQLVTYVPIIGVVGLVFAGLLYLRIVRSPSGSPLMKEISDQIHDGAMTFLRREYSILLLFIVVVAVLLWIFLSMQTSLAFIGGAACSILAGFSGMKAATRANVRTTAAAKDSGQGAALLMAFDGGAVMGVAVASLGLIGVGLSYQVFFGGNFETLQSISGFAMGASSIALFARVGGGIYTKAADVGADLVGSRTTWETTSATSPAWVRTSSSRTSDRSSRPSRSVRRWWSVRTRTPGSPPAPGSTGTRSRRR